MLLYEFPNRYALVSEDILGSLDDLTWFSHDRVGSGGDPVPAGAALFVRGWAPNVAIDGPASNVVVVVDGVHKHRARAGLARPDVAQHFANDRLHDSGFEGLVTTGRLAPGEHEVTVFTVDAEGWRYARLAETKRFTVLADWAALPGPVRDSAASGNGNLDEVRDESRGTVLPLSDGCVAVPQGAMLSIRGWYVDPSASAAVRETYALVDGERSFPITYGTPRPDAAREFDGSVSDHIGFEGRIPTAGLERARHLVELVAVTDDGIVRTPITFAMVVGQPSSARIVLKETTAAFLDDIVRVERGAPRALGAPLRLVRGDRLFVRGWAIDEPAHSLAAGVVLVVDGEREFPLLYGLPRHDIAGAFNDDALLRAGFTGEIDTALLPVGLHSAECRVLAGDGRGALATMQRFDFEVSEV